MKTVRATQGQLVDEICREHYGDESSYVEAVLNVNPGLGALGPGLPAGTLVCLPDVTAAQDARQTVTLWD
ncbi:tail protein X [Sulfitobacter sp. W074]|uniref:tail protein X n=1 Tax=Sulfitobacter sp. W074 TaxID=2867026 RepID=UPI0021A547DD|nr:tail protein X [Sulfitobacter sp. W074]UWR36145.1 tail protein X [Sulfitobacter sp. W074]